MQSTKSVFGIQSIESTLNVLSSVYAAKHPECVTYSEYRKYVECPV